MSPVPSRLPPPHPTGGGRITLTLPVPPSVNQLYHRKMGQKGVYKDAAAKKYEALVYNLSLIARVKPILSGDVTVLVTWHRAKKIGDVDNRLKVLMDAIKRGICIGDDDQVRLLAIEREDDPIRDPGVDLVIVPWEHGHRVTTIIVGEEGGEG